MKNVSEKIKARIYYFIAFILFVVIEVLIALYVHDTFIRPYIGDVLVVIVLYCSVRIIMPERCHLLPLWIFLFAAFVEWTQYMKLVELLGWQDNRFISTLMGTSFDWKDIMCYAVGCLILGVFEVLMTRRKRR